MPMHKNWDCSHAGGKIIILGSSFMVNSKMISCKSFYVLPKEILGIEAWRCFMSVHNFKL